MPCSNASETFHFYENKIKGEFFMRYRFRAGCLKLKSIDEPHLEEQNLRELTSRNALRAAIWKICDIFLGHK